MQNREILTLKLLPPNRGKAGWLEQTAQAYDQVVQQGSQLTLEAGAKSRRQVHGLVYPLARRAGLPSLLARQAAQESLSNVRAFHRSGHLPAQRQPGLGLAGSAYKLQFRDEHWVLGIFQGDGSLVWFPLLVPEKYQETLEFVSGDARLVKRKGEWFVLLPVQRTHPILPAITADSTFIGIDLGVVHLATLSAPEDTLIVDGHALRHRRRYFDRLAERYCCAGRLDRVPQLAAKERRWMSDHNHKVARRIVALAQQYPQPVLVLENLDGLHYRKVRSERFATMSQAWDFRQLVNFIEYKACQAGVRVMFVDPRGTSNTCPQCQHSTPGNASQNGRFHCLKCGYLADADLIAACNIARRGRMLFTSAPA